MSLLQRIPANKLQLVAIFVIAIYPLATAAARFDVWHFRNSFLVFALTTLVAFAVLVFAVLKLSRSQSEESRPLITAIVLSAIPLAFMGLNIVKANQYPFIHDITTDLENPPQFVAAAKLRGEGDHPIEYDGDEVAAMQKAGYPDLVPLVVSQDPMTAFNLVKAALLHNGLEISSSQSDELPYTLEAVDTTLLMGFKDDIVVRIQQDTEGQTRIDARSKSRQGKSDLGKNAQRIEELFAQLVR